MDAPLLSLYLRLLHSKWLSQISLSRLLNRTRGLSRLFATDDDTLLSWGLTPDQLRHLRISEGDQNPAVVEKELSWAQQPGHYLLCYEDPRYPCLLRELDIAPPLLYVSGDISTLTKPQLAIVGSRNASSYGLRNAYWMAHELGQAGLAITSGMARGIDTRAHVGALAANQSTIAVVGTGVDVVYPRSNRELADRITGNGAIVSEFALGTPPLAINFPRRNRIMSGLCHGTLVIEAALKSGSLITARLALEQNRDVFAVPGLISSPLSAGCHALINDGARLVQEPLDVLQELGLALTSTSTAPRDGAEACVTDSDIWMAGAEKPDREQVEALPSAARQVMKTIGDEGVELQQLLNTTGKPYQALIQLLLGLELAGRIRTENGRYYRC